MDGGISSSSSGVGSRFGVGSGLSVGGSIGLLSSPLHEIGKSVNKQIKSPINFFIL